MKGIGKFVPVHAMTVCGWSGGTVALIPNLLDEGEWSPSQLEKALLIWIEWEP
jgi:hypothetical protein